MKIRKSEEIEWRKLCDEDKDLLKNEFGFIKSRRTIQAFENVIKKARKGMANKKYKTRKLCAVITLDVQNAFDSANWEKIIQEFREKKISYVFN